MASSLYCSKGDSSEVRQSRKGMEKLEHRVKLLLYSVVHSIVHSTLPVHFPVQQLETPWLIEPHQLWSLHGKFSMHVQCNIKMLPYLIQSILFIELVYVPFTEEHDGPWKVCSVNLLSSVVHVLAMI